jgi:hypothetical protein
LAGAVRIDDDIARGHFRYLTATVHNLEQGSPKNGSIIVCDCRNCQGRT